MYLYLTVGFPSWLSGKESACQCWRLEFDPWVEKIPWWRKWKPTPVFLPGKPHGTEEPGGLQQMGCKELDMTAQPSRSLLKALYCMLGIQRWTRGTDSLPSKTLQSTSVMSTTKEEHRPLQDCRGCERHNLSQETRAGLSLISLIIVLYNLYNMIIWASQVAQW